VPVSYIDLYVEDAGAGHKIYFIAEDNTVADTKHHMPWFALYTEREVRGEGVVKVDGVPLIYDESLFIYVPKPLNVYKVKVMRRSEVPDAASRYVSEFNAWAGLYNIRYEARVAFDFSRTHWLFGVPAPLVFLPNREMAERMAELVERASGFKVMAVDIEVYSPRGGFPRRGDPLLTISYATFKLGDDIFSPEWPEENVKVLSVPRDAAGSLSRMEAESRRLVERLFEAVLAERPNFIVTYNGSGFDIPYMSPFRPREYYLAEGGVLGVWRPEKGLRLLFPHIDLFLVRKHLGSSMGVRSHVAYALDDVALEVARQLKGFYGVDWLFDSEYVKAERLLNHAKLKEYWERGDRLFHSYVVADVYLTCLIARMWLYSLFLLSALTGIPPTVLQTLNTGQAAEYLVAEYMHRLGFYPELRERALAYSKVEEGEGGEEGVFARGKVYVDSYGVFGGNGRKIVELDFAQLYPTDMVANAVDPTIFFVKEGRAGDRPLDSTLSLPAGFKLAGMEVDVVLGSKAKRASPISADYVLKIVPGYGPVAWFTYKLYTARKETKELKRRAKELGRVEYQAPDQAVKILNNSLYGAFAKSRGNLVNEVVSAAVFWRTQKMLYEVIDYINREVPGRLGGSVRVVYGDTDSAYIEVDEAVDPARLAEEVNRWVHSRYGPLYSMELEDVYDAMLIPKQKDSNEPSAKSYICIKGGKPAKVKGEFFKLVAPVAVKERLLDFYMEVIRRKPSSREEVRQIVRELLEREPVHKWFIRASVSSFVNEDDPRKLKQLNKDFHYAALYTLLLHGTPGVQARRRDSVLASSSEDRWKTVTVRVNPRDVERTQRAVVVHYLPHPSGDPKKFIVYAGDDGENVTIHVVSLQGKVRVEREGSEERDAVDKYYVATFAYSEKTMEKSALLDKVLTTLDKYVVEPVYKKLAPALRHQP